MSLLILFFLGLSTSGASGLASAAGHAADAIYWSKGADDASALQTKTVLLDIPDIAERVNKVVVNIRSMSDTGENLGSGFIIDQKGLIVTNFHLISAAEQPRRGAAPKETNPSTKLVERVSVTLHDGRQFPASIKGYDEA